MRLCTPPIRCQFVYPDTNRLPLEGKFSHVLVSAAFPGTVEANSTPLASGVHSSYLGRFFKAPVVFQHATLQYLVRIRNEESCPQLSFIDHQRHTSAWWIQNTYPKRRICNVRSRWRVDCPAIVGNNSTSIIKCSTSKPVQIEVSCDL
jgi:hypothetical protein